MGTTKPTRRKKEQVEDHYKVLGLRSNSRHERIKEKYIQLVKEYTPEQYPEEFERIRRAYEALRDPVKRQEYNLVRKFGGSIEKAMKQAVKYMDQENWAKAETTLLEIIKMAPQTISARASLAQISLIKNEMDGFEQQMQALFQMAEKEEEQADVLALKAKLLAERDYEKEALSILDQLNIEFPEYKDKYRGLFIGIYLEFERGEQALQYIEMAIASLEDPEPDHILLFVEWIHVMISFEQWRLSDKIQKRVRNFLKVMRTENAENKDMIADSLINEYEDLTETGNFRGAAFYMDLLYVLDSKHPLVVESRQRVQEYARIQSEVNRMMKDEKLFPLVSSQAIIWFYEEAGIPEFSLLYQQMMPLELLEGMDMLEEEYAIGIKLMQKKYPLLYRRYKKEWDKLFEKKAAGLNREARRRLK